MGSWDIEDVEKLDPRAFESPYWRFETCNAATKVEGKTADLVEEVTRRTKGVGYGYRGKSDFEGIMGWFVFDNERIEAAEEYPQPGKYSLRVHYSEGTKGLIEWK